MASIKLVDGIAESFRKEPRRARRKIFDVKNPQQYLHRPLKHPNGYGTSVHIMLYTSSVAVAIRERVPGHVLGGSMKKKRKKFLIPYAHHSRKNWRQEKPKQVAIQTRPEKY
jgi:hypothetical protein